MEYLLYAQEFLENTAKACDLEYTQLQKECMTAEAAAKDQKEKIGKLRKNLKTKKQSVKQLTFTIKEARKTGPIAQFPCKICKDKYYKTQKELDRHFNSRHKDLKLSEYEENIEKEKETAKQKQKESQENRNEESNKLNEAVLTEKIEEAFHKEISKFYEMLGKLDQKLETVTSQQQKEAENLEKERESNREMKSQTVVVKQKEIEKLKDLEKTQQKRKTELSHENLGEISYRAREVPSKPKEEVIRTPDKRRDIETIDQCSIEKKKNLTTTSVDQQTDEIIPKVKQEERQHELEKSISAEEKKEKIISRDIGSTQTEVPEALEHTKKERPSVYPVSAVIKEATIQKVHT